MPQVNGVTAKNLVDGCGIFQSKVGRMLAEKGIQEILPDKWYDLNDISYIVNELGKVYPTLLIEIGKYVPKNSKFPSDIDTLEKALLSLDQAYKMNHKGEVGKYIVTKIQDGFRVVCKTKHYYAPNYNLGILKSLCRRFGVLARIDQVGHNQGGEFVIRILNEKVR